MKLDEISRPEIQLADFDNSEVDFMKHWAQSEGYKFSLDTPAIAAFTNVAEDDSFIHIDFSKEKSNKVEGKFHYRVGSSVTTDEDEFPGHVEFLTPAFADKEKLKFLDRALTKVVE